MSHSAVSIVLEHVAPALLLAGPVLGCTLPSRSPGHRRSDTILGATLGGALASVVFFVVLFAVSSREPRSPGFWFQWWLFLTLFTAAGALVGVVALLLDLTRRRQGLLVVAAVLAAIVVAFEALSLARGFYRAPKVSVMVLATPLPDDSASFQMDTLPSDSLSPGTAARGRAPAGSKERTSVR